MFFVPLSYYLFFPTTEEFNPALLNQEAYGPWAMFGGLIMIVAIIVCAAGTRSEIPRLLEQQGISSESFGVRRLLSELWDAFSNKNFRALFFGMILSMFIISVEAVFNPFMNFHFWGMTTEQLTFVPIGPAIGLCLSVVLVPILTRRFDKKPTLIGCAIATIININTPIVLMLIDPPWFPEPGSTALLIIMIVSQGITILLAPVIFATINSMFADIADEHELEVGERREGVIFAARSFANKASASAGLVFGGLLLDLIAFPRGASLGDVPADTVWQLGFIAGPATSVFTLVGLVLYLRYRIDRKRHEEIMNELASKDRKS